MTTRDRTVVLVAGALAVIAAFWFLALSPKRKDAQELDAQIATAQTRLETATVQAANAENARQRYNKDYATVARLGKAVPADDDTASLVYAIEHTAEANKVDFRSIKMVGSATPAPTTAANTAAAAVASANGTTPAAGAPATSASVSTLPPGSAVGPAGFPTMPFAFEFESQFFDLQGFIKALNRFTRLKPMDQGIDVNGRLLTIEGISLQASDQGFPRVKASVAATAYLLPADQGLTAGATPAGPTGTTTTTGATSAITGGTK